MEINLKTLHRNENALGFVAVCAETGERLANLAAEREDDVAEISYWVAAGARGRGVAGRAVSALCQRIGAAWPVAEFRLWTHVDNVASQRVAERAGFRRVDGVPTKDVRGEVWSVVHFRMPVTA